MNSCRMRGGLYASAALVLALAGCDDGNGAGDGGMPDGSTREAGPQDGGTDGSSDGATQDASDASEQATFDVELSQNPENPLSLYVDARADVPVHLEVQVEGPGLSHTFESGSDATENPSVGVWGLRADSTYDLVVSATPEDGSELAPVEEAYETPSLPDDLPPIEVNGEPTAGYTLFSVFRWNPENDSEWGLLLVVDQDGEVIWIHRDNPGPGDARQLDNGHILYAAGNEKFVEVDMMGRVVVERTAEDVGTDTVHHEVYPLPDGGRVFLSSALHTNVEGYLDEEDMETTEDVVSDVVVEIDAEGDVVHEHDLFDVLDPLRTTPDFFSPFWTPRYGDQSDAPRDWTHGNALVLDETDDNDSFVLSLRHQDWLVKLDRESGELVWTFGVDGDFTLEGGGSFPNHQHAPELLGDGRILLFDNGNAVMESRAVLYELDETAMTAEQVWEFTDGSYAPFVGDADMLEGGNVLATFGGIVADGSVPLNDPENLKSARIIEADSVGEVVWQLDIEDTAETDPVGYTVYRAERLEDLYP